MEGRGDVRRKLDGADRARPRDGEARGDEGGRPNPHPEQLPGVEGVAEDEAHRGSVPQHGCPKAHALTTGVEDVGRCPECEPQDDDARDRAAGAREERERIAARGERRARDEQRKGVTRRRARDEPPHSGAAALGRVAVGEEHDRRRVGPALRERDERVKDKAREVRAGPEGEGERRDRAEPGGAEKHPARADAVGERGEEHERYGVAELEAGRDRPRGGR